MTPKKLTILFLAADPVNMPRLQLDEELHAIDKEVRQGHYRNSVDLRSELAPRYGDLQELLLRYKPSIVHFSGHGNEAGEILLKDEVGAAKAVPPQALARLFVRLKASVRCVVLNACYTEQQATAIAEWVDCVVGMPQVLSDDAASDFAAGFYLGLGYGKSVGDAFDMGCDRIVLGASGSEATPRLLALRIDPYNLVLLGASAASSAQKSHSQPDRSIPSAVPQPAHQVYLAYCRRDKGIMRRLRTKLLEAGISVWVDDLDLQVGNQQWHAAIERAIRAAKCMVVILSPEAKASQWVNIELELAKRRELKIFPVLARGNDDTAVPLRLILDQYEDVRTDFAAVVQDRLLPVIRRHLGMADTASSDASDAAKDMPDKPDSPGTRSADQPDGAKVELEQMRKRCLLDIRRTDLPAAERALVGQTLAELGDPRIEVTDPVRMEFCLVPIGSFVMGEGSEEHEYDVAYDYWIARYPVTVAQYAVFESAGGYHERKYWLEAEHAGLWQNGRFMERNLRRRYGEPFDLPNHPAVGVSWYEALAFIRWLDEAGAGKRLGLRLCLPSEPEWEKSARGGLQIVEKPVIAPLQKLGSTSRATALRPNELRRRPYPWGAKLDPEAANYDQAKIGSTSAVGCFAPGASPYGVEELSGNMWEWTRNQWGEDPNLAEFGYVYHANDGREHLTASVSVLRVVRGGAFYANDTDVSCASRNRFAPTAVYKSIGFRVVVTPFPG